MATKLKRIGDLPDWFDLKKYSDSKLLNAAGWYEQLVVRRDALSLIDSPRWHGWKNLKTNERPTSSRQLDKALHLIRENPILDVTKNDLLRAFFYGGELHEIKTKNHVYTKAVHLATVRQTYLKENNIDSEKKTYARTFFSHIFRDDWLKPESEIPKNIKHVDWIDEPIDAITNAMSFKFLVSVNMLLPDSVLVEQFKQMLNEQRDGTKGVAPVFSNYRKPEFNSWINFGVLPYLDLQIWAKESGVSIPNRVMADAIFPAGEGGEEVVRKTTSKLAHELLSLRMLQILTAFASAEKTEQNAS